MIIKVTFGDNDFTDVLKEYMNFHLLQYKGQKLYLEEEKLEYKDLFVSSSALLKKVHFEEKTLTTKEKTQLKKLLREDLEFYITQTNKDSADYLIQNLSIELKDKIGSQWENDENVYYFCSQDVCVIM